MAKAYLGKDTIETSASAPAIAIPKIKGFVKEIDVEREALSTSANIGSIAGTGNRCLAKPPLIWQLTRLFFASRSFAGSGKTQPSLPFGTILLLFLRKQWWDQQNGWRATYFLAL